jgi:uncharacterized membrane protein HdeD (DUF308 family)
VLLRSHGVTLGALVLLICTYALLDRIVSIIGAVRAAEAHDRWGSSVVEGLVGIGTAVITLARPAITSLVLIYVIAG